MAVRELLLSSSALILLIALTRPLLRERVPPGLRYALWLPVLLRLALPVRMLPAPVSPAGAVEMAAAALPAGFSVRADPGFPWPWVWAAGSICMGAWFFWVNARLNARLRRTRRLYARRGPVAVYTAAVASPCLYGLFRPAVYLSERAAADPAEAELVIAHELTHRRHGDHIWAAVRLLCLTAYWFDPFVWLAASLSKRDGELFCDGATLGRIGAERRFEYGRVLLSMAAPSGPEAMFSGASTMSAGGRRLRERIALVAGRGRRSVLLASATVLVFAAAVGFAFSGPAEAVERVRLSPAFSTPEPVLAPSPTPWVDPAVAVTPEPTPTPTAAPVFTPEPHEDTAVRPGTAGTAYPASASVPGYTPVPSEPEETRPTLTPEPTPLPPSTVPYTPGPGTTLTYTDENGASYTVYVTAVPGPTLPPVQLPDRGTPPTPPPEGEDGTGGASVQAELDAPQATREPVPEGPFPTPSPIPAE